MISAAAVVSSDAHIGSNVEIGHFCVIESGVTIGNGCKLDSHVVIRSGVTLGENNQLGTGSVLGGSPQHVSAKPPFGRVCIGNNNVFREHTTVHRALEASAATTIGDENYLMAGAHVGHDCTVGNHNILVNGVMLGGHGIVGNRANIGGGTAVHQNCRIGSLAMIGGQARIVQDVPPFMMVDGLTSKIVGLNLIGLRRNHRSADDLKVLKSAYFVLYRSTLSWKEILQTFKEQYTTGAAAELAQFLLAPSARGIIRERTAYRTQLRVVESDDVSNHDAGNIENVPASTLRAAG